MCYLSLFFFFGLLSLSYAPPGDTVFDTTAAAQEPIRFCSMAINATCYCCDWSSYATNLAYRSMGVIIGCGVTFIVLLIALCCCCWDTSLKDNLMIGEEAPGAWCHSAVKALLMVIPLVLFLAGCIFVLIAHYNLNPIFISSAEQFRNTLSQIDDYEMSIINMLANIPPTSTFDDSQMLYGINDVTNNINNFVVEEGNVNIGRNVIVWFACGCAIIASILGCIYVQYNKGVLFECFCACAIFLILGSCCTIAALDVIHNVSTDLCVELNNPNGIFQLWQTQLSQSIQATQIEQVNPQEQSALMDACSNLSNMCSMTCCRSTCGLCNLTTVPTFLNRTIDDNGVQRRFIDCPQQCKNTTLKMITNSTVNDIDIIIYFSQINILLDNLLVPIKNPLLTAMLKGWICELDPSVGEIWAGCGLFIGGAIVSAILCMLLRGKSHDEDMDQD